MHLYMFAYKRVYVGNTSENLRLHLHCINRYLILAFGQRRPTNQCYIVFFIKSQSVWNSEQIKISLNCQKLDEVYFNR